MKITRGNLRAIIREMLLREQDETAGCDRLLAAVLASEVTSEPPVAVDEMRAIYDVIQTRAKYRFKGHPVGDIAAQITAKGQFSGYNDFKDTDSFIAYYSGTAPDSAYSVPKEKVATEKFLRKKQFKRACDAVRLGPRGYGATHFVNPQAASTELKWWETENFKSAGMVGKHLFGWETSASQALEAYNDRNTD